MSDDSVLLVTSLLIHTNGSTTSLEVKNLLRSLNYKATQSDVSEKMKNITEVVNELSSTDSGKGYLIYKFKNDGMVVEDVEEDTSTTIEDYRDQLVFDTPTGELSIDGSKELPISKMYESPTDINTFTNSLNVISNDDMNWIVNSTHSDTEYLVFNKDLSRDKVRNLFAKIYSIKKDDVRSRRYLNFNK